MGERRTPSLASISWVVFVWGVLWLYLRSYYPTTGLIYAGDTAIVAVSVIRGVVWCETFTVSAQYVAPARRVGFLKNDYARISWDAQRCREDATYCPRFRLPLWWLVVFLAASFPLMIYPRIRARRRIASGRCACCGYSQRGLPDNSRCPECGGDPWIMNGDGERRLRKRRVVVTAVVLGVLSVGAWVATTPTRIVPFKITGPFVEPYKGPNKMPGVDPRVFDDMDMRIFEKEGARMPPDLVDGE